jgi:hypothetical protein
MTRLKEPLTDREYGAYFPVAYSAPIADRERHVNFAILSARATLPVGTVFEIRAKTPPSTEEEDANWGIAWYHAPKGSIYATLTEPLCRFPADEPQHWEEAGLQFIARLAV